MLLLPLNRQTIPKPSKFLSQLSVKLLHFIIGQAVFCLVLLNLVFKDLSIILPLLVKPVENLAIFIHPCRQLRLLLTEIVTEPCVIFLLCTVISLTTFCILDLTQISILTLLIVTAYSIFLSEELVIQLTQQEDIS